MSFVVSKGVTFTINDKKFVVTQDTDVKVDDKKRTICGWDLCTTDTNSAAVPVIASEVGEDYNIPASSTISSSLGIPHNYSVTSSAMTGGTSKKVKVVGKEDIETAISTLSTAGEEEAREELTTQFSSDYILLGSMSASEPKITTSPELNQEVGDNVTPKIVREVKYTVFAVNREAVNTFIKAKLEESITGDQTQQIYDTGIDKAFFESFQNAKDDRSAKLKATTKTGPRVTNESVAEMALGRKIGEVQSRLKSLKGVAEVKIDTSYFWVTAIPDDINKVQIEITVE